MYAQQRPTGYGGYPTNSNSYGTYPVKQTGSPYRSTTEIFAEWAMARSELFPSLPTLMLFLFFGPPTVCGILAATDASTRYWIGIVPWFILLVPLMVTVGHMFHFVAGRPRFYPFICSTIIPSIVVIVVGFLTLNHISVYSQQLLSTDCTTYSQKFELDNAYRAAAQVFDGCVARVSASTNSTLQATAPLLDISDCSEYTMAPEADKYSRQWWYLKKMEETEACSGWCTPGEPSLWTRQHVVLDLCASVAGDQLAGKVNRLAQRMIALGVAELFISILLILAVQGVMTKLDIEW